MPPTELPGESVGVRKPRLGPYETGRGRISCLRKPIKSDVPQLERRHFRNDHVQLDLPNFLDRQKINNAVNLSFVPPSVHVVQRRLFNECDLTSAGNAEPGNVGTTSEFIPF